MGERRLLERRGDADRGPKSKSRDHGQKHKEQESRRQDRERAQSQGEGKGRTQADNAATRRPTQAQASGIPQGEAAQAKAAGKSTAEAEGGSRAEAQGSIASKSSFAHGRERGAPAPIARRAYRSAEAADWTRLERDAVPA